jgi:menaquinone-specific isochorismate synthase
MENVSESMAWLARGDGSVVIGHGPFRESDVIPESATAFYQRDFATSVTAPWKIPAKVEHLSSGDFVRRYRDAPPPRCEWSVPDAGPFSAIFQEVMAAIREGMFEKTVPVVVEKGICADAAGPAIVAAMARQTAPLCSYGWVDGEHGFAGATPELLISLRDQALETMALAGTAKREDREVFAVDEKEIREHEYVAQTLVSKLQGLGNPQRKRREILDLGSIVHFLTLIQVALDRPASPDHLIERLHPTPALGPLPRTEETLALLLRWRQQLGCPETFGAPFGLWHQGRFDAVVAIRGLWWDGNDISLPAGCGIIEASRLVNEWRELRLKRDAVKRFLD